MPYVDIEDSRVEYRVEGDGPGLLLVHGIGWDADSNWGRLGSRLAASRRVLRPNYSGAGRTVDRGGPLTLERLGRQVVASAWATGAAPFDLVGFGLGSAVAAYVAATLPDLVRSLVLIAGFADANDPSLRLQLRLRMNLVPSSPDVLARLMMLNDHSPTYLAGLSEEAIERGIGTLIEQRNWSGVKRQLNLALGIDLHRVLKGITCPTLVVACEQDRLVPPGHSLSITSMIREAEATSLSTGHLAPVEDPEALAALLERFVARSRIATT